MLHEWNGSDCKIVISGLWLIPKIFCSDLNWNDNWRMIYRIAKQIKVLLLFRSIAIRSTLFLMEVQHKRVIIFTLILLALKSHYSPKNAYYYFL